MPKLTLSVDAAVVERAKEYAADCGTSVSSLVQTLLEMVASPPKSASRAPVLAKLRGSMRRGSVADYRKYLERKYR
jgi:hypothetical protein